MLRSTRNEFFIGFTISVILSLFANFTLLIRRYNLMMDSKVAGFSFEWEKYELWFSVFWFFFFSFAPSVVVKLLTLFFLESSGKLRHSVELESCIQFSCSAIFRTRSGWANSRPGWKN